MYAASFNFILALIISNEQVLEELLLTQQNNSPTRRVVLEDSPDLESLRDEDDGSPEKVTYDRCNLVEDTIG